MLQLEPKKKAAVISTLPRRGTRYTQTFSLGLELTRHHLDADLFHWTDKGIPVEDYDTIGFSVCHVLHNKNVRLFLKRNFKKRGFRHKRIIVGGQGAAQFTDVETFLGEVDGNKTDKHGLMRASEIVSPPIIKHGRATIEVTRGCKYKCHFCEYGCYHGGSYREKDLALVKEQLKYVRARGINTVNLFSTNLGGYSDIDELVHVARSYQIFSGNTCLKDTPAILPLTHGHKTMRIGVESFDEATRKRYSPQKFVPDSDLFDLIGELFGHVNYLYIYLIYGLPGDNYDKWFEALYKVAEQRRKKDKRMVMPFLLGDDVPPFARSIRAEFAVSSFDPMPHTPLKDAPTVDFAAKQAFIDKWISHMVESGFRNRGLGHGRFGAGEAIYNKTRQLRELNGNCSVLEWGQV